MMIAIAIDDEPPALKVIEKFCADYGNIELIKTFNKPTEGLKFAEETKIDFLFLDINMPSISGIELYKSLKKDIPVIFTTAYSEFAVEGFDLNASDYLLKPFTYERFKKAIKKIEKELQMQKQNSETAVFSIRADYALHKIPFDKILYFEGYDDYVKIHIEGQKTLVARVTMKNILERLDEKKFSRVHRSYIVALDKIQKIKSKSLFINDVEIPVSVADFLK
jgi:DNA-binding LytR/AlgR family response regulator